VIEYRAHVFNSSNSKTRSERAQMRLLQVAIKKSGRRFELESAAGEVWARRFVVRDFLAKAGRGSNAFP
jgi:hypothetical protein